jgi:hypothetical protein
MRMAFTHHRALTGSAAVYLRGESLSMKQTRGHARLGWFQPRCIACCRCNKLPFSIVTNARYVPRMLVTVRFDREDRGYFVFDERCRRSPRDRRCGEPDQDHECMTKFLRDAGYGSRWLSWPGLPVDDNRQRSASRGRIGDLRCHDRASGDCRSASLLCRNMGTAAAGDR